MKKTGHISLVSKASYQACVLVLTLSLLLTSGCGGLVTSIQDPGTISRSVPTSSPLLICLLGDTTMSMEKARSTPVQEKDLLELLALLRESGGELGFSVIGEATNLPLVRVRIPSPPSRPNKPADDNPFVRAEKTSEYSEATRRYEAAYQKWEADVKQRVDSFLIAAHQRLALPVKDRTSPVYEAITRAQLFLGEQRVWPENSRRMIVLQSDCQDTTRHKPVEMRADTAVLVVNGSGSLGVFANARSKPKQFESMPPVLEFIRAEVRR